MFQMCMKHHSASLVGEIQVNTVSASYLPPSSWKKHPVTEVYTKEKHSSVWSLMFTMGEAEIKICSGTQMLLSPSETKSTMGFFSAIVKHSPDRNP